MGGTMAVLHVEESEELLLHRVDAREHLSQCFRVDAVSVVPAKFDVQGLLVTDRHTEIRLRLEPYPRRLGHRRASRMFRDVSTAAIVEQILAEHRIGLEVETRREAPLREYCVEHEETDLVFVERLLAEEGFAYFFKPPAGNRREVVAILDRPTYPDLEAGPRLRCRPLASEATARQRSCSGPKRPRAACGNRTRRRSWSDPRHEEVHTDALVPGRSLLRATPGRRRSGSRPERLALEIDRWGRALAVAGSGAPASRSGASTWGSGGSTSGSRDSTSGSRDSTLGSGRPTSGSGPRRRRVASCSELEVGAPEPAGEGELRAERWCDRASESREHRRLAERASRRGTRVISRRTERLEVR
jgi:hypothetical protein